MNVLLLLTALDSCLSVRAAFIYIYIYIGYTFLFVFLSFILLLLVDIIFLPFYYIIFCIM